MKKTILSILAAGALAVSCNDTWNEHYQGGEAMGEGQASLLTLVDQNPELSDFAKVLRATHLYNNMHVTPVTYADLLDSDQSLTVWAPVNGSFNADSLLQLCQTAQGDSAVGQHFVGNHIAHNLYNMNSLTDNKVKMVNNKMLHLSSGALVDAKVRQGGMNLPATNGLLNIVEQDASYTYNIYEALTSLPEYAHLGGFLKGYETSELDEEHSIVASIEDGQKVYSDSVMKQENILFRTFDYINSEDSAFTMLVPTAQMWEELVTEARPYFNYGSVAKADSIQNYWMNVSLMQDLIFNNNAQRSLNDSVIMTSYSREEYPYHVYYKPYGESGILNPSLLSGRTDCSNGTMYQLSSWPFNKQQLFFRPITVQGEREANLLASTDCTVNYRNVVADSVSGNGYMVISPRTSTSNWTATFEVQNTLAGTYDLSAVVLPKTVYNIYSRDVKPNKFTAVVNYVDADGKKHSEQFKTELSNNPREVDTIKIARITLPVCNYRQADATVSVQLKCSITSRQTTYSREMYLDCLYLQPVEEEEK